MIICNGPYMFNTLVDLAATYSSSSTDGGQMSSSFDDFVLSLYMTDMANLLVVLSSATDWLLFYQWKRPARGRSRCASVRMKGHVISREEARTLTEMATQLSCEDLGCGLILILAQHNSDVNVHFGVPHLPLDKSPVLLNHGRLVGRFIGRQTFTTF